MKKHLPIALSVLVLNFFICAQGSSLPMPDMTITSWNLTHANKKSNSIDKWVGRKGSVANIIRSMSSDIYGFQEVIENKDQLKTLENTLPGYGWVGEKRNAHLKDTSFRYKTSFWLWAATLGAQDESCPIFYNKETLELVKTRTFGITTDDSYLPRIATVACFRNKLTRKEFCVCNSHFDHKSEKVRTVQAGLVATIVAQECEDKPVILMGDFNTAFDNDFQMVLTQAGFVQGKKVAHDVKGPHATHKKSSTGKLIECDHILIKPESRFDVKIYETGDVMSRATSDHNWVGMTFFFKEQ